MKVYLDACCLSRLTDDQSQARIRREAMAVESILRRVFAGDAELISSEALADEVRRNPSIERRLEAETLLSWASVIVAISPLIMQRARELTASGYGVFDAYCRSGKREGRCAVNY